MSNVDNNKICPVERAGNLNSKFRRLLQNPQKILNPYLQTGITVLDIGCGPGYFSLEMAKMIGPSGKVIAADVQQGMLDIISEKIKGTALENTVELYKCNTDRIDISQKADFILCFYMVHEVPDRQKFITNLKELIAPGGFVYIAEPKFHVKKKVFESMLHELINMGFSIVARPRVFYSCVVVLTL